MRYYDGYHDPDTHLQLSRQTEEELIRAAKRRDIWQSWIGFIALLTATTQRFFARNTHDFEEEAALEAKARDDVIRELRAVRQQLEALEAKVQQLRYSEPRTT
jgi:hypothetical protein